MLPAARRLVVAGLVCWTLATIVVYDWTISSSSVVRLASLPTPRSSLVRSSSSSSQPPRAKREAGEVAHDWVGFNKAIELAQQQEQQQPVKGKENGVTLVLVITPTPEPEIDSLIRKLRESGLSGGNKTVVVPPHSLHAHADSDDAALRLAELGLFKRDTEDEEEEDWRRFPDWVHREMTKKDDGEFRQQVLRSTSSNASNATLVYHSDLLPQSLPRWLPAVAQAGKGSIVCVVGRRASLSEQVFLATSQMAYHRMSALEVKQTITARMAVVHRLCEPHRYVEFELDAGAHTWKKQQHQQQRGGFPRELATHRDHSVELNSLYLTATTTTTTTSNDNDDDALVRRTTHEAYVSILTARAPHSWRKWPAGSFPEYLEGVVGLGRSLAFFDASRERILMVTASAFDANDTQLAEAAKLGGWTLLPIDPIAEEWFSNPRHGCKWRATRGHQTVRWGRMASKLRAFELVHKRALLYLDLDIVVTGRVGELFDEVPEEFVCVSEGGVQHPYLNAGFLFLRPSREVFQGLMQHFTTQVPPRIFNNLIDCTEMGLLNAYFGLPERAVEEEASSSLRWPRERNQTTNGRTATLPLGAHKWTVGRPDTARDFVHSPPLAVHFIRKDICPKPWERCGGPVADATGVEAVLRAKCEPFPYVAWCAFRGQSATRAPTLALVEDDDDGHGKEEEG